MHSAIFRKPVTVKRRTQGAYVDGFWVEGTESTVMIRASVQPASSADLNLLPEGKTLGGVYKIFTNDTLIVATEGTDQNGDRLVIGGSDYEVTTTLIWDNGIIPHNEYLVTRVQG